MGLLREGGGRDAGAEGEEGKKKKKVLLCFSSSFHADGREKIEGKKRDFLAFFYCTIWERREREKGGNNIISTAGIRSEGRLLAAGW